MIKIDIIIIIITIIIIIIIIIITNIRGAFERPEVVLNYDSKADVASMYNKLRQQQQEQEEEDNMRNPRNSKQQQQFSNNNGDFTNEIVASTSGNAQVAGMVMEK